MKIFSVHDLEKNRAFGEYFYVLENEQVTSNCY